MHFNEREIIEVFISSVVIAQVLQEDYNSVLMWAAKRAPSAYVFLLLVHCTRVFVSRLHKFLLSRLTDEEGAVFMYSWCCESRQS